MTKRFTVDMPEELLVRLAILADAYDCGPKDLAVSLLEHGVCIELALIEHEDKMQVEYLTNTAPAGHA